MHISVRIFGWMVRLEVWTRGFIKDDVKYQYIVFANNQSVVVSVKTARLYCWSVFKSCWGSSFFTLMKVLWRHCIDKGWQKAMEVMIYAEYRGKGRVEWMVYHSDCQYLHHSLLPAIMDFLSQSDENFTTIFTKKIWMHHFGKFTSIWNCVHCQYCTVSLLLCCIILHSNSSVVTCGAALMKYCLSLRVCATLK